jgi:hypothetical protein
MSELYRVLKKGGTLIAQVPLDENRTTTFEDNSITDSRERSKIFGQYDHVRIYGKDYFNLLGTVGFLVKEVDYTNQLNEREIEKYGLKRELIPVAKKP